MNLKELIRTAIKEDMPSGDLTTESLALLPRFGRAKLIAKEDLVVSGMGPFEETLLTLEPSLKLQWHFHDGDLVLKGQIICTLIGDLIQILKGERVALNFIGHLSGIATLTRCFVNEVKQTKTKILDTRKTLPGYRELEKKAVVHGGGVNHRMNLSDAVLIKDNHIRVSGGIGEVLKRVKQHTNSSIEIECSTLEEIREAVPFQPQRILLDNMNNETLREALELIPNGIETEASGNMSVDRVKSVASLGVDFISVGALTHSAPCADMSMIFDWTNSSEAGSELNKESLKTAAEDRGDFGAGQ